MKFLCNQFKSGSNDFQELADLKVDTPPQLLVVQNKPHFWGGGLAHPRFPQLPLAVLER